MNSPHHIATRFYDAMASGSVGDLEETVRKHFSESATLARPESLPGGGVLSGAPEIMAFLGRAAGKVPLVVNKLVADESGENVFASVTITLAGRDTEAVEWWTFTGERVASIRAFYWDTAAMLGVAQARS